VPSANTSIAVGVSTAHARGGKSPGLDWISGLDFVSGVIVQFSYVTGAYLVA